MSELSMRTHPYVSATLRTDMQILDRAGNKLGKVTEVMIDMATGTVEFAIISFGGFMGLGQKYHPLPFQILHPRDDKSGFVIDADTALIDGSPAYRVDDAPVFDAGYGDRLRSYYGINREDRTGAVFPPQR